MSTSGGTKPTMRYQLSWVVWLQMEGTPESMHAGQMCVLDVLYYTYVRMYSIHALYIICIIPRTVPYILYVLCLTLSVYLYMWVLCTILCTVQCIYSYVSTTLWRVCRNILSFITHALHLFIHPVFIWCVSCLHRKAQSTEKVSPVELMVMDSLKTIHMFLELSLPLSGLLGILPNLIRSKCEFLELIVIVIFVQPYYVLSILVELE